MNLVATDWKGREVVNAEEIMYIYDKSNWLLEGVTLVYKHIRYFQHAMTINITPSYQ